MGLLHATVNLPSPREPAYMPAATVIDISIARTFLEIVKTGSFVNAAANLNLNETPSARGFWCWAPS